MSALTDARDLLASAHKFGADLFAKTIDIHLGDSVTAVVGWSSLSAVARDPSIKESQYLTGLFGIDTYMMFEISRQGTFVGSALIPQNYKVKFGGVFWEIIDIIHDDTAGFSAGAPDAAVYMLACRRIRTDKGRFGGS